MEYMVGIIDDMKEPAPLNDAKEGWGISNNDVMI